MFTLYSFLYSIYCFHLSAFTISMIEFGDKVFNKINIFKNNVYNQEDFKKYF